MNPILRPYQVDVIARARSRLRQGVKRVLIQAPTGSGKTHISSEIIRSGVERGKRWLFLAHRRRLIQQKSERLDSFGVPHGVLMAGHRRDLSFRVQVASRDTLLSRAVRNDWLDLPRFDGLIVDEAHHCMAEEYQTLLSLWPEAVILGLTATPARSNGKGLGSYFDALECTVPVSQLVREGYLCPVLCYAPVERKTKGPAKLIGGPVENWLLWGEDRPTVLFASKVETSRAACAAFNDAGIPAAHIDAHTEDGERDDAITRLKSGALKVVCNVGIWTEGVDVPELSCCILLRMAHSYVLFAQAVGRIMRAHPSKQTAILIDHAGAVKRHGFPDEDVQWELGDGTSIDERIRESKKKGKAKEPIVCPRCYMIFSGSRTCPACGHELPRHLLPLKMRRELLEEVTRCLSPEEQREERGRYWQQCLRVMAAKGQTCGAAASMYQSRFGSWPREGDCYPLHSYSESNHPVTVVFPQYAPKVKLP